MCADGLALVNEAADVARFGPAETLFNAGDKLAEVNFLVAGQVAATHSLGAGEPNFVDVVLPVRSLCLPAALLGLPTPVGMRTLTTARLIVVAVGAIREALTERPPAARQVLDCALQETHEQALDLVRLKTRSSPQRLWFRPRGQACCTTTPVSLSLA
jgi:CRP-like cAMP-binding protein